MNQEAFDTFWYWINERHRIFLKKEDDEPKPWTADTVLQKWKFCNPFRANDKQTRLLLGNVIRPHLYKTSTAVSSGVAHDALMLFNIYAFRAFNWWPTYHHIADSVSPSSGWINKWEPDDVEDILETWVVQGEQKLTSGAYMIRGREGMPKYQSIVITLDHIWRMSRGVAHVIKNLDSIQAAHTILMEQQFWGWGHFTTYQVVLDLMETPLLTAPTDVNSWCEFGPGAERGLRCIWPDLPHRDMLDKAKFLLSVSYSHLEPHVPAMNLQDIEFSLCELSKYLRIKNGGKGKEGYAGHP